MRSRIVLIRFIQMKASEMQIIREIRYPITDIDIWFNKKEIIIGSDVFVGEYLQCKRLSEHIARHESIAIFVDDWQSLDMVKGKILRTEPMLETSIY